MSEPSNSPPTSDQWWRYPITVYPQHTDYAGVVWHGTYIAWLEAARGEALKSCGLDFTNFVALGCDLPVVEMALRYHQFLKMGAVAMVCTRLHRLERVKIKIEQKVESVDGQTVYFTAMVTLVLVDAQKGKIRRQMPPAVQTSLTAMKLG